MTTATKILSPLLELLKIALNSQYYMQPISSEMDEKLSLYIVKLMSLDRDDLCSIIGNLSRDDARVLGLYAERMATLAVRSNSVEPIKNALVALLIYAKTQDSRDVLLVLSLLYDAAVKTAGTANNVFNEVASFMGDVELLNGFLCRSDEDKSIEAMGYKESKNEDGFLYVRTW